MATSLVIKQVVKQLQIKLARLTGKLQVLGKYARSHFLKSRCYVCNLQMLDIEATINRLQNRILRVSQIVTTAFETWQVFDGDRPILTAQKMSPRSKWSVAGAPGIWDSLEACLDALIPRLYPVFELVYEQAKLQLIFELPQELGGCQQVEVPAQGIFKFEFPGQNQQAWGTVDGDRFFLSILEPLPLELVRSPSFLALNPGLPIHNGTCIVVEDEPF